VVEFKNEQIDRAVAMLRHIPGAAEKAMARAINRAIKSARAATVKQIRMVYRAPASAIRLSIGKPIMATPQKLRASLTTKGRRLTLYDFGPTPKREGTGGPGKRALRIAVRRDSMVKAFRGAFVIKADSGKMHVAVRSKSKFVISKKTGKRVQKIRALYSPAAAQMAGKKKVIEAVEAAAQIQLDARLDHEINAILNKYDKPGRRR
jgi:hypothetical protein